MGAPKRQLRPLKTHATRDDNPFVSSSESTWKQSTSRLGKNSTVRFSSCNKSASTPSIALGNNVSHLLFRGQGDADWALKTTLDRAERAFWTFSDYFQLISSAQPQIETFTERQWHVDDFAKLRTWAEDYDSLKLKEPLPAYDYLVYLRHHGFPSPLLDWTRSAYVAAFFAFAKPSAERVAVYAYCEDVGHGKLGSSNTPRIMSLGPRVRSHRRHFLQQCEYTIAAEFKDGEWQYAPHQTVFASLSDRQDRLRKFTLPATERRRVLRLLDDYNLNEFSLFQSEEALLSSIAMRELVLSDRAFRAAIVAERK
jgi:hypothetical protein